MPGYLSTFLPATFYNSPYPTEAEMCSVTFSLVELVIPLIGWHLSHRQLCSGTYGFPPLWLRIFPLQAGDIGSGYFTWKRNLFEWRGGAHRIKESSRDRAEELIAVAGMNELQQASPVLKVWSLEIKSSWLSLGTCPCLRAPWLTCLPKLQHPGGVIPHREIRCCYQRGRVAG